MCLKLISRKTGMVSRGLAFKFSGLVLQSILLSYPGCFPLSLAVAFTMSGAGILEVRRLWAGRYGTKISHMSRAREQNRPPRPPDLVPYPVSDLIGLRLSLVAILESVLWVIALNRP